ncbi:hypothetical protein BDY24DRAFT_148110 [Mrakia frigida]|uniref:uncharacterized protein n=1 Tax=Mrakia frigida TaxID=29902 RepID=UPI003FCC020E
MVLKVNRKRLSFLTSNGHLLPSSSRSILIFQAKAQSSTDTEQTCDNSRKAQNRLGAEKSKNRLKTRGRTGKGRRVEAHQLCSPLLRWDSAAWRSPLRTSPGTSKRVLRLISEEKKKAVLDLVPSLEEKSERPALELNLSLLPSSCSGPPRRFSAVGRLSVETVASELHGAAARLAFPLLGQILAALSTFSPRSHDSCDHSAFPPSPRRILRRSSEYAPTQASTTDLAPDLLSPRPKPQRGPRRSTVVNDLGDAS